MHNNNKGESRFFLPFATSLSLLSLISLSSQWCSSERDKQRLIKWLLSQSKRKIKSKSNKKVFVGFRVQKERRVKRRRDRSRGISVISVVSPPCSYPRLTWTTKLRFSPPAAAAAGSHSWKRWRRHRLRRCYSRLWLASFSSPSSSTVPVGKTKKKDTSHKWTNYREREREKHLNRKNPSSLLLHSQAIDDEIVFDSHFVTLKKRTKKNTKCT